ncbi:MAG: carbamate kinase [Frankiales bacterium]|nr:carbamate kinase [Frankiales bacterium]
MRIVVALGGNALLRRGEQPDADVQLVHVEAAAAALAPLAREHDLVVCHGNGPQVGLLALESDADRSLTRAYPLDALVAQTQGMIGYWLTQALVNAGVDRPVVALVTQVVVDEDDPAFRAPTKFIGPVYEQAQAHQLAGAHGWTVAPDGPHWRRVVPSPLPVRLVEQATVEQLVRGGATVVCGGGGGAPVTVGPTGRLQGREAVVDKDLTAALLAVALRADHLLVLTDVAAVMEGFGTPSARPLPTLTLEQAEGGTYPAGSMGPKVAACAQFVRATGRPATIGALSDAAALLTGLAGTTVQPPGTRS